MYIYTYVYVFVPGRDRHQDTSRDAMLKRVHPEYLSRPPFQDATYIEINVHIYSHVYTFKIYLYMNLYQDVTGIRTHPGTRWCSASTHSTCHVSHFRTRHVYREVKEIRTNPKHMRGPVLYRLRVHVQKGWGSMYFGGCSVRVGKTTDLSSDQDLRPMQATLISTTPQS